MSDKPKRPLIFSDGKPWRGSNASEYTVSFNDHLDAMKTQRGTDLKLTHAPYILPPRAYMPKERVELQKIARDKANEMATIASRYPILRGCSVRYNPVKAEYEFYNTKSELMRIVTNGELITAGKEGLMGVMEGLMGIMDDLARMAAGASMASVMGMFNEHDRVVLRTDVWNRMRSLNATNTANVPKTHEGLLVPEYRFGTVDNVRTVRDARAVVDEVIVVVKHDVRGLIGEWDPLALMHMDEWIGRIVAGREPPVVCLECYGTHYIHGDPERGECHCFAKVDFKQDDDGFAARRRAAKESLWKKS